MALCARTRTRTCADCTRSYCENLVSLNLAQCTRFSDRALEYFPATRSGLPMRIEQLDLSGCEQLTARGHAHLVAVCTRLKLLVLDHNAALTDESLQVRACPRPCPIVAPAQRRIAPRRILHTHSLHSSASRGPQVFSERCTELQSVSLKHTPGITERGLASLAALPHLRRLKFEGTETCCLSSRVLAATRACTRIVLVIVFMTRRAL